MFERLPTDSGSTPSRSFSSMARYRSFVLLVKEVMKSSPLLPEDTIRLKPILYMVRSWRVLSPGGTDPAKKLWDNRILWSLVMLCSVGGYGPVNSLKQQWKTLRVGSRRPTSLGISPYRLFAARAKVSSEETLYKDGGTVPVRLFTDICSCFRMISPYLILSNLVGNGKLFHNKLVSEVYCRLFCLY